MPGPPWRGGWRAPRERMFEKGELKYLFLDLLREKPRHGYDLIRAIDEASQGRYTASPGAVYPILQMLEDLGHVSVSQADGRKTYTVTPAGEAFLAEHADTVAALRRRIAGESDEPGFGGWRDLKHELGAIGHLFARAHHMAHLHPEVLPRVFAILSKARREIEAVLDELD